MAAVMVGRSRLQTIRNNPCPCGSGRKYKACCLDSSAAAQGICRQVSTTGTQNDEAEYLRFRLGAVLLRAVPQGGFSGVSLRSVSGTSFPGP
ncbi:SEC-C metal-binding domain-containing protein [Desulfocurvibacter africanus]|uniref:SEC-C metal-binding domain-containing protein n=1 Tax=Desulfocurvibacter africanus TaxID=873 RepID=UPI0009DC3D69